MGILVSFAALNSAVAHSRTCSFIQYTSLGHSKSIRYDNMKWWRNAHNISIARTCTRTAQNTGGSFFLIFKNRIGLATFLKLILKWISLVPTKMHSAVKEDEVTIVPVGYFLKGEEELMTNLADTSSTAISFCKINSLYRVHNDSPGLNLCYWTYHQLHIISIISSIPHSSSNAYTWKVKLKKSNSCKQ